MWKSRSISTTRSGDIFKNEEFRKHTRLFLPRYASIFLFCSIRLVFVVFYLFYFAIGDNLEARLKQILRINICIAHPELLSCRERFDLF